MKILIKTLTDFKSKLEPFLKNVIKKLTKKNFEDAVDWEARRFAKMYLTELKINMLRNTFNFKLKPETIRRKGSDLPFIETKQLYHAVVQEGDKVIVKETIRKSKRSGRMSNREIAMILEFGRRDKGIPARPIFRMTMRKFKGEVSKDLIAKCRRSKK